MSAPVLSAPPSPTRWRSPVGLMGRAQSAYGVERPIGKPRPAPPPIPAACPSRKPLVTPGPACQAGVCFPYWSPRGADLLGPRDCQALPFSDPGLEKLTFRSSGFDNITDLKRRSGWYTTPLRVPRLARRSEPCLYITRRLCRPSLCLVCPSWLKRHPPLCYPLPAALSVHGPNRYSRHSPCPPVT